MSKQKAIDDLTYEEAYTELEAILEKMESGENPLQEAMDLFDRGQALVKHCTTLLEKAELRIRQLAGDTTKAESEDE
jgi:exodeoxyribonuclease VII small subunit